MWSNWKNDGCPEFKKPEGQDRGKGGSNTGGKQNGKNEEVMSLFFLVISFDIIRDVVYHLGEEHM